MIREILFWIAEGGWLLTTILYALHIKYMQDMQRQYLVLVNKELEYLIKLRYEFIRFIEEYNSRHEDKIIWDGDKITLVNPSEVEPINMDEL